MTINRLYDDGDDGQYNDDDDDDTNIDDEIYDNADDPDDSIIVTILFRELTNQYSLQWKFRYKILTVVSLKYH